MKFQKKIAQTQQTIPTASLPDIIFMLLIFFMVTTVLREVDILVDYTLPEAVSVEKIDNKRLLSYIWIGSDERIQIDDSIIPVDAISNIAYQKRMNNPNIIMSLRIDKGSRMGIVSDVQQELRRADALRINYSALNKL
ncbi:MAG: biopolymer transporter ExbD [Bacteroidota bacterium]|jgi:biopolymer transport protein ExbD|nr:biopolymer transporter ExbD [Bacteroidota bacterium]